MNQSVLEFHVALSMHIYIDAHLKFHIYTTEIVRKGHDVLLYSFCLSQLVESTAFKKHALVKFFFSMIRFQLFQECIYSMSANICDSNKKM